MKKECFDRAKASPDPGVLVHLVCNAADTVFYSEDPDSLPEALRTVLCVETFFSAICDGGFEAWFNLDHGQLACCGVKSLRRVGLKSYADLAEQAIRFHHDAEQVPATVADWNPHLERIRSRHRDEDCSEVYDALDTAFFLRWQSDPEEFRIKLREYILAHEGEILEATAQRSESGEKVSRA